MQELIAQLLRLYLPAGSALPGSLPPALDPAPDGTTRVIVIPFEPQADARAIDPWQRLCEVANALQGELGLPAPAVSVSGATGFRLWLSFEQGLPLAQAMAFLERLRATWIPELVLAADALSAPIALPPCVHPASGKWAAFIHPGMGASFIDEPGLDMAPPAAAQAAFLDGLKSISPAQLAHAWAILQPEAPPAPPAQAEPSSARSAGLLLADATLEDIVHWLHARNIEPTFRHLLPARPNWIDGVKIK